MDAIYLNKLLAAAGDLYSSPFPRDTMSGKHFYFETQRDGDQLGKGYGPYETARAASEDRAGCVALTAWIEVFKDAQDIKSNCDSEYARKAALYLMPSHGAAVDRLRTIIDKWEHLGKPYHVHGHLHNGKNAFGITGERTTSKMATMMAPYGGSQPLHAATGVQAVHDGYGTTIRETMSSEPLIDTEAMEENAKGCTRNAYPVTVCIEHGTKDDEDVVFEDIQTAKQYAEWMCRQAFVNSVIVHQGSLIIKYEWED